MPDLSSLLAPLASLKTSWVVFLFSAGILFFPFPLGGIERPSFSTDYETFFVIIFLLSAARLIVEFIFACTRLVKRRIALWRFKRTIGDVFHSLNLEELCVLWAMTQGGVKTIQGSHENPVLVSLWRKGCLRRIGGFQYLDRLQHEMPDEVFRIVSEKGFERFPKDFRDSVRFEDEVRDIIEKVMSYR